MAAPAALDAWSPPGRSDRAPVGALGAASCRLGTPSAGLGPDWGLEAAQGLPRRCSRLSNRCEACSAGRGPERRRPSKGVPAWRAACGALRASRAVSSSMCAPWTGCGASRRSAEPISCGAWWVERAAGARLGLFRRLGLG